jgi:hypothetical protein
MGQNAITGQVVEPLGSDPENAIAKVFRTAIALGIQYPFMHLNTPHTS